MSIKISLITYCKQRLADAKKFLPGTIDSLRNDDECVLVDFDDGEHVQEWAMSAFRNRLIYVKVRDAPWWEMNRARNVGARASTGDILVFNDIDQQTTSDAIEEIRRMTPGKFKLQPDRVGACGFVAMWREDFIECNGYEEGIVGYGHDDTQMYDSLRRMGRCGDAMINEIHRQHDPGQVRVIAQKSLATHCLVNRKILRALRILHPWKNNQGRDWGRGGEVVSPWAVTHGPL